MLTSRPHFAVLLLVAGGLAACGESSTLQVSDGTGPAPKLPPPNKTLIPTVNIAPAVGWEKGAGPVAAPGTRVTAFAEGLDHPRWLYVLPNGDVLVAETNAPAKPDDEKGIRGWVMKKVMGRAGAGVPSPNRITLLRDTNRDGVAETRTVFVQNLNSPFGMTLVGNKLYVADTDRLISFPYQPGQTSISTQPTKVIDLPGGTLNHHWTKNVIASKDGSKLYVTTGSNSNVGENGMDQEEGRAAIWEPVSGKLWTAVNERDEIGSDLVPDYVTSVQDGGFYGWPYSYYGQHVDERVKPQKPDLVAKAIVPDYAVGPHTASLGLVFADGKTLAAPFNEGLFIGQHGSWNRKPHSGYKVVFIPFKAGKPNGAPVDVLTGFLNNDEEAMGRPVGVVNDQRGGLLVADDVGNKIWRVTSAK
jgi:glucose/arabinose dehydrogenase